jgi:hypothetical protein
MNFNKGDIIKITFIDCESFPGWSFSDNTKIMYLYAVGFFLKQDNLFTDIYMGYNTEGGLMNVQRIPNGSIIKPIEKL